MRSIRLLPLLIVLALSACGSEPETISIRLVDEFDASMVHDSPPLTEPERSEWRFDGEGTIMPEESGETGGWVAWHDVEGLRVEDGRLVGRTGEQAVLRVHRTDEFDAGDQLYGVEVRMRVSAGTQIGLTMNGATEEPDEEALAEALQRILDQPRPRLMAELTPGDEFQTYLLREAGETLRLGSTRNLALEPTDAEGAEFEIESVRIVSLEEHLSAIPSGPGWHGLSEIYRETIVARTPERIVADVSLPEHPWLDLAFGTIEDGPVTFRVDVAADGTEASLLRRTETLPDRWTAMRFDLAEYAGRDVTLTLSLEGAEPGMLGYWGSPVIRNSGAMPENDHVTDDRAALGDAGERRPKAVILFLADTQRRDHLQMYGYERDNSPTLLSLAEQGVVFEDNIAQGSWTKVSVPSMLTSLYPSSHGITDIPDRLPSSVTTLAEAFRDAGYATWQTSSVPFTGKLSNLHQGVDVLHERGSIEELEHAGSKTARTYVDRFLRWADDHHDIPFFALIHVFDPHSVFEPYAPYDATWGTTEGREEYERGKELWEGPMDDLPTQSQIDSTDVDQELFIEHEKDWYDGSIRAMDQEVARLMEGLEELGIADETLFVFVSDHGEEFLEHGYHFHGNNVYGEMVNVPLMMWWPGVLPAGTRVERTTENIDMMPTVLELAGVEPPEEVQGQSLLPLIVDPGGESDFGAIRRAAFAERVSTPGIQEMGLPHDQYAIVLDGWKLVKNENHADDWPEYELYDHEADPLNLNDVASEHPDVVERLASELETWREYALARKPPPDSETLEGLSEEEIARLRSLGYINN
jgi:arylsulfatase A-like enzyme